MFYVFTFLTPIIAIIFFVNCVSIAKKLKNGGNIDTQTVWGSIMFGFIIFSLIGAAFLSN